MQKATKTLSLLLLLCLASYTLQGAKSVSQPELQLQKDHTLELTRAKRKQLVYGYCRGYGLPKKTSFIIICFVHDNLLKYNNKPLPHDLSGQDLSDFDFTGCRFMYTNLADTNLTNVILTNTTCDYQKAFLNNSKENKLTGGDWYQENLPKDLKSIAQVYPKLNNNMHKAKLLQVASVFSFLPFYEDNEFYIKVYYWSSTLLQLKKLLGNPYAQQLVCSLQSSLEEDTNEYCWTTNYPQDKVNIDAKTPHANFDTYLKDFKGGLAKYQCKSKNSYGFNWYRKRIIKNIKGLKATYPHIKEVGLQQTACDIAHALSKSYQVQQGTLKHHYIFCQDRLVRFKKSVGVRVENKVYYNTTHTAISGWNRG